eukprot:gnl/Dysnectes_brevis/2072_a2396_807.p1 GENE.gnl/Dysnectes_brevis/2072_a2396_807~~gnl/Dysnectes_brevis/2072_a2396_807.p1  ORF type:complete len:4631 (+),score=1942.19 gnl/Dysnectes_brevis/2072_a2396_807:116-13894(+)
MDHQNQIPVINSFFLTTGPSKLIFCMDRPDGESGPVRIRLTTSDQPVLFGHCVYFLRVGSRNITTSGLESDIVTGQITESLLPSLQALLQDVFLPALRAQNSWGSITEQGNVDGFLGNIRKYVSSLSETHQALQDRLDLTPPSDQELLEMGVDPAVLMHTAQERPELVTSAEKVLAGWCEQIELFLAESDQIRQEGDDVGPDAELTYWRARMSKFNNVQQQITQRPWLRSVLGLLQAARSSCLKRWNVVRSRVVDGGNEAKDNLKYLYTIEDIMEPLYRSDPVKMVESLPHLLSTVRMVHGMARFYSSSEHMTSLFVKISSQMIMACRAYIKKDVTSASGSSSLWDSDWSDLMARMEASIHLNNHFQAEYRKVKQKVATETPTGKQFNFSEACIFGNFDLFCQRLRQVVNIFTTALQFTSLRKCTLPGLGTIMDFSDKLVTALKRKPYDLLDHRHSGFETDYRDFLKGVAELEAMLKAYIDEIFSTQTSVRQMLRTLQQLQQVLSRDNLRAVVSSKYELVLARFADELVQTREHYEAHKASPPIPRNMTPVAGNIMWSRLLLRQVEEPMAHFRAQPNLLNSKTGRKVVRMFNRLSSTLQEFEEVWYNGWTSAVSSARHGLQATLLVRHPKTGKLYVNFDRSIVQLCREAHHLSRLGLAVPETARAVTMHEEQLLKHRDDLALMLEDAAQAELSVHPVAKDAMEPLLARLRRRLAPGLRTLCWTSMNIQAYVASVRRQVHRIDETSNAVNDILAVRIASNLQCIANTCLAHLPLRRDDEVVEGANPRQFLERMRAHCIAASESIILKSQLVYHATHDVIQLISSRYKKAAIHSMASSLASSLTMDISQSSTAVATAASGSIITPTASKQSAIDQFVSRFHEDVASSIFMATEKTLRALQIRVRRLATTPTPQVKMADGVVVTPAPFLRADIELSLPQVRVNPGFPALSDALDESIRLILSVSRHVPRWHALAEMEVTPSPTNGHTAPGSPAFTAPGTPSLLGQSSSGPGTLSPLRRRAAEGARSSGSRQRAGVDRESVYDQSGRMDSGDTFFGHLSRSRNLLKLIVALGGSFASLDTRIKSHMELFRGYQHLWVDDKAKSYKAFLADSPTLEQFRQQIMRYEGIERQVRAIPDQVSIGGIELVAESIKNSLLSEAAVWKQQYGAHLNDKARTDLTELTDFVGDTTAALSREVSDLEDVRQAMVSLSELREMEAIIDQRIVPMEEMYAMLSSFGVRVSADEVEAVDQLRYRLRQLQEIAANVQDRLKEVQPDFKRRLITNVKEFIIDVREFKEAYDTRGPNLTGIAPRLAVERLKEFQQGFAERERKWQTYSGGEELFGLPVTPYPEMVTLKKELKLLNALYGLYTDVLTTVDGYGDQIWVELDFDQIAVQMQDYQQRCTRLPKAMRDWEAYLELKKRIEDFGFLLPLFQMLSHPAVQGRHWKAVSDLCKTEFDVEDENFRLRSLLDAPLLDHNEDIEDICNAAQKETDIDEKLSGIRSEWQDQVFNFMEFKTRGLLQLSPPETSELITLLEDTQMLLGSLVSNRYNAHFKDDIVMWVKRLSTTDEVLTLWLQVQQAWIYLEAVFNSGDIARQLPQEAKRFSQIDKSWVKIMNTAVNTPNAIHLTNIDDTLRSLLPHLTEQLELCQKSLSGYLESKRNLFPRFYFVSDPVLLEILGQQSDPQAIQPHLSAIFDSITHLDFDRVKRNMILAMSDKKGEKVPLSSSVEGRGNIEDWLTVLIENMQTTMRDIVRQAAADVLTTDLQEFIDTYPAQVTLLGIQLLWTAWCEQALKLARSDKKIMGATLKRVNGVLSKLVSITTQDLTKRMRTNVETLVTIQVHQRDVFEELVRGRVRSASDFDWLKQTRFYWLVDKDTCNIQITDIDFEYNFEYLGVQERLVITPLTDRCYITLAQAIGMFLGGAPAGPAGTGKTETVKDMGKTLGMYVVVFNCSDQMDYKGLGKIFRGLAQAGCWGDFDEFNRIELEVLSVAAQQIQCILAAKKERKKKFMFTDGQIVPLNSRCAYFITMNPGYAGRQELPENLKALFRTVAMMVPDREIIIKVKLSASGFTKSSVLSKKFFILYRLCEEQLSQQRHYDFGLRNILSVLRTCGANTRANPDATEEEILMRVLQDMNMSKLVDEDVPLFISLTEDLFPGLRVDKSSYPELEAAISEVVREKELVLHDDWILSVIQLYETSLVRHGIMVLGPALAGKTECIDTLARSFTKTGKKHTVMRMNPKAITAPQMFGRLDASTGDWTDGIFSTLWRRACKREGEFMWIVLDGPVDSIWIENLNTVLDDNKTLTLANNDRIPMSPTLKLIFEVDSLRNASPATVSRAGMIYMSTSGLGWAPLFQSWLAKRPQHQATPVQEAKPLIKQLYKKLELAELKPVMHVPDLQFIRTFLQLIGSLLPEPQGEGGRSTPELPAQHVQRIVYFSIMWAFGGLLTLEGRSDLTQWMRTHPSDYLLSPPGSGSVFDYFVSDAGQWKGWSEVMAHYEYPPDHDPSFNSILIPTMDNTCVSYLLGKLNASKSNVMLIGESGSGKTVNILRLLNSLDKEETLPRTVNFSSATTTQLFQDNIEGFVEKRMGQTYGPPAGKKGLVFIDDINIPQINEWNDQPTNEITRQTVESRGFFSLIKPGEFHLLDDITFMAAMPLPGGGRNDIPPRLKGHFCVFNVTLPAPESLDHIFGTIVRGHYSETRGFSKAICKIASTLVPVTRQLWAATKARMLPTPAKFHYIFNLRDLSRITQGLINSSSEIINTPTALIQLWAHECSRVLPDKFTNYEDITWFADALQSHITEAFDEEKGRIVTRPVHFSDFMRDAPEVEDPDEDVEVPKIYEPVLEQSEMVERIDGFMSRYNDLHRRSPLGLVLFQDCVAHIVRISRILRTPSGNALLVGVGGSGKQSCTRLASFIAGYNTFQLTITRGYNISNFDDDLKILYQMAGVEGKGVTFLFTDNEIKQEVFLERINNILTSGEVPALFPKDEMDVIISDVREPYKAEFPRGVDTNDILWQYFIDRVKANLHVVLCFSPVNPKFRVRARKFPGLISGCTTDWFQPWPREALTEVARRYLSEYQVSATDEVKEQLVEHVAAVHLSMEQVTREYFERYRRQTYVTPKSYLSFLSGFKDLYSTKLKGLTTSGDRLNTGLEKLKTAAKDVARMQTDLEQKEKDLAVAQAHTAEMLVEITASTAEAEKQKAQVQKVADALTVEANIISEQKAEAEAGLAKALPALKSAERALEAIEPGDIATLKKLATPPHLIQRIMDAVCILLGQPIDKVTCDPDKPPEEKLLKPSWRSCSLPVMTQSHFLQSLVGFERDCITDETCELLDPYLNMADFNIVSAKKSSGNVSGLLQWVTAMHLYHFIALDVEPKRKAVREAESKYKVAMAELNTAQANLAEKQAALDILREKYEAAMAEKQRLQNVADLTARRLSAASALINGLSGERVRWSAQSKELDDAITRLIGDIALASAFLSYAGPFNQEFRQHLLGTVWMQDLQERNIPFTEGLEKEITSFLVTEAQVGEWRLQGLPTDDLSTQNAIIVTTATRYPLLIDPQTQAAAWIKSKEPELRVTTLNAKNFRQTLEDSLNFGYPLLIEDAEEELDPVLDPILEKQFVRSGKNLRVSLGDKDADVMPGFMLFITSKLPNPRYSPETYAKTSIIDFTVTISGLTEQLLARTVNLERKELESQRRELLEEVNANKKKAEQLEEDLLFRLSSTKGNLLDDATLVDVLNRTKATTQEVKEKLRSAVETEKKINEAREEYLIVATRGSILYFLITELALVNHMYQTSLGQFLVLFDQAISEAATSPITSRRINNIIDHLTFKVFAFISRGLFESDKLLFVLQLCLKIDMQAGRISPQEFQAFIKGGAALDINNVRMKPSSWIPDIAWLNVIALSELSTYAALPSQIADREAVWRAWYDQETPENSDLPPEYAGKLSMFQKLLLVRAIREDRAMLAATDYIIESLGERFAESIQTNLEEAIDQSDPTTPLMFLLSLGSDPSSMIETMAKRRKTSLKYISMGQGQEVHARRLIREGFSTGGWVLISNSHLGLKFMVELEDILTEAKLSNAGDDTDGDTAGEGAGLNKNFRLILTTEPHPQFPIGLLQKCIKLTNDPPTGCRAGLRRSFQLLSQDTLEQVEKPAWLPLLYVMAFLFTTVQERRKYGPLGWCVPYEFSTPDFTACVHFLQTYLYALDGRKGAAGQVSYATLRYMISEIHLGGRVTDDFDRRLLLSYSEEWVNPRVLSPEFNFYQGYSIPTFANITELRAAIELMPLMDKPQIYGLHPNAELTFRSKQATEILGTIMSMQPKDSAGGGGESREDIVLRQTREILAKMPPDYNLKVTVRQQILKLGGKAKPLNVFLGQEVERMQTVLHIMRSSLKDLQLAISGTIVMSDNLQNVLDSLFDARVPDSWSKCSWPSSTLGFWLSDVLGRCVQYTDWLTNGKPSSFWLTGFFNPTGFLTAMKQDITRAHPGWALDKVVLRTNVMKMQEASQVTSAPEEGVYIHGLFLDGASWDRRHGRLVDQPPKVLFVPLPILHVDAMDCAIDHKRQYECPVYKTPRRTDLTFIFCVWLPTDAPARKWVLRGTALLCATQ